MLTHPDLPRGWTPFWLGVLAGFLLFFAMLDDPLSDPGSLCATSLADRSVCPQHK